MFRETLSLLHWIHALLSVQGLLVEDTVPPNTARMLRGWIPIGVGLYKICNTIISVSRRLWNSTHILGLPRLWSTNRLIFKHLTINFVLFHLHVGLLNADERCTSEVNNNIMMVSNDNWNRLSGNLNDHLLLKSDRKVEDVEQCRNTRFVIHTSNVFLSAQTSRRSFNALSLMNEKKTNEQ